VRTIVKHFRYK